MEEIFIKVPDLSEIDSLVKKVWDVKLRFFQNNGESLSDWKN